MNTSARIAILVAVTTLASLFSLEARAESFMTVTPNPATTETSLLVTVTSDSFFCRLFDPVYLEGSVVVINATTFCDDPPPPEPPTTLYTLLPPLEAGIWEIQLNAADLPVNYPLGVIETVRVTVTDPRYGIKLEPHIATEDDEVIAHLQIFGTCPEFDTPEVSPGLIRIDGGEPEACVPFPPSILKHDLPLGKLEAGNYLVELHYRLNGTRRVAEHKLFIRPSGACVPSATTLCLNDGRFRVEASWTTGRASGSGHAIEETDETGAFSFFSADNIELMVKVLDGCATPLESFWVYAAGLTDVGVTLRVTDTVSGITRKYGSPTGSVFESITDTAAFSTCP